MYHSMADDRDRARQAKSAKSARRTEQMRDRITATVTPEARLSAAFDWFRGSTGRLAKQGKRRDGSMPNRAAADRYMREMADYLAQVAAEIDGGPSDDAE